MGQYLETTERFFDLVDEMSQRERIFRMCLCLYPNILMLRLLKSFRAQPRLAVVTHTLELASQDIVHFSIVFCSIYVCMAVNSLLFFGQDIEEFSTFIRAIHTCFLVLFGDWDWPAMQQIGYLWACVWFWLFLLLMFLVLLNIMLAIIMEAYTNVKK